MTKRPLKIQSFKKNLSDAEYEPVATIQVDYPTLEQVQEMLEPFGL
jgi:hypothetical protein